MNIKHSILSRVRIALLVATLAGGVIFARILFIQWVHGEEWRKLGEQIALDYRTIPAVRGNIYAEDGNLLATSLPYYWLAFDPTVCEDSTFRADIDKLSEKLSQLYGDETAAQYKHRIVQARKQNRQYMVLNRTLIRHNQKRDVENWPIFRLGRLRGGIIFNASSKRYRPFGHLAHRTIGYVNEQDEGAGLEYSLNHYLAGVEGRGFFQRLVGGHYRLLENEGGFEPENGKDIVSTLDVNLQDVTEAALLRALQYHEADFGCAVVMEVATGEIKAISNLTRFSSGKYGEAYNYAVGDATEPGSTFKLASMIALLEDADINLSDSLDTGNGTIRYYDRLMRDSRPGGYGKITVKQAFAKSSNIGISKLVNDHFGERYSRFMEYLGNMGLTRPLNFQLAGEGVPYFKSEDDQSWSGTTLPWMSIGYEIKMAPIHTLALYNAIANDGKMIQPIIVKEVKTDHKTDVTFEAQVIREQICSRQTLGKVRELLEEVVVSGTASNISGSPYNIAGKTGTAKKYENGHYTDAYYTSFAGYFPASNPKYSCIVVVDAPKGFEQYGSDVAAPVFKEIADKLYAKDPDMHPVMPDHFEPEKGVYPVIRAGQHDELAMLCNTMGIANRSPETHAEWVRTSPENDTIVWKPGEMAGRKVPDVRGMTLRDALYLLEKKGLKVSYSGMGRVEMQSLTPNTPAREGQSIFLTLERY